MLREMGVICHRIYLPYNLCQLVGRQVIVKKASRLAKNVLLFCRRMNNISVLQIMPRRSYVYAYTQSSVYLTSELVAMSCDTILRTTSLRCYYVYSGMIPKAVGISSSVNRLRWCAQSILFNKLQVNMHKNLTAVPILYQFHTNSFAFRKSKRLDSTTVQTLHLLVAGYNRPFCHVSAHPFPVVSMPSLLPAVGCGRFIWSGHTCS